MSFAEIDLDEEALAQVKRHTEMTTSEAVNAALRHYAAQLRKQQQGEETREEYLNRLWADE